MAIAEGTSRVDVRAWASTPREAWSRADVAWAILTGTLVALAYLPGLTAATPLPDELTYLEAGRAYLQGDLSPNPQHPPLAKFLFGAGQAVVADPVLGGRLVAVLSGMVIAGLLYGLMARIAGRRWGLVAAAVWAVLPHALRTPGASGLGGFDKLDRYAMLDVVATALAFGALVATVHWLADGRLRWVVLAGLSVGLAGGAKLSGLLLLPVVAAAPLLSRRPRFAGLSGHWAVLGLAAATGFAVTYAPFGVGAFDVVRSMIDFQSQHVAEGHRLLLGGEIYQRAPWWTPLYFHWRDDGALLTILLAVSGAAGMAARDVDWRVRGLLAAGVLLPATTLSLASVHLPHYRFLWLPPLVALGVIGARALSRGRAPARTVVGLMVAAAVAVGGSTTWSAVTRAPSDYHAVALRLDDWGLEAPTALVHGYPALLTHYRPEVRLAEDLPADLVIIDPQVASRFPASALTDRLADDPSYQPVTVDRLDVWVRRG